MDKLCVKYATFRELGKECGWNYLKFDYEGKQGYIYFKDSELDWLKDKLSEISEVDDGK